MKTEIESATAVAQIVASLIIVGSDILTKVYFVRHAQPLHSFADDRTRPLTDEGYSDAKVVLDFLMDKNIDTFYSSPYKRSVDTITSAADFMRIIDWMPYVLELDFDGTELAAIQEHVHLEKIFKIDL